MVPIVDYLHLGERPYLTVHRCTNCGANFFDRRNACARCSGIDFAPAEVASTGTVRTFSIVFADGPGIEVPYVPAVVDCDGISVRGNLVDVPPDPAHLTVGMTVRLVTFPVGTDVNGVQAIGFGFAPSGEPQ